MTIRQHEDRHGAIDWEEAGNFQNAPLWLMGRGCISQACADATKDYISAMFNYTEVKRGYRNAMFDVTVYHTGAPALERGRDAANFKANSASWQKILDDATKEMKSKCKK